MVSLLNLAATATKFNQRFQQNNDAQLYEGSQGKQE
jgi:hypothetical protein